MIGLTATGKNKPGWLACASFREATNVLADAAIEGYKDYLKRPKSQVIIARNLSFVRGKYPVDV